MSGPQARRWIPSTEPGTLEAEFRLEPTVSYHVMNDIINFVHNTALQMQDYV